VPHPQRPHSGGARPTAAVLTFALDGETPVLAAGRRYAEHAGVVCHQAFEAQVGLPRLLRLLADYSLKATFFVPGYVAERNPDTVSAVLVDGHEVAHHSYSHRRPTDLVGSEDRREFELGLEALQRCGVTPLGYRAPMWAPAWRTADLVAEFGMIYDSSFMDDDNPYLIETAARDIVEIPPHWSLDDWEQYAYLPEPHLGYHINDPMAVSRMWVAELEATRRHDATFVLTGHGFLSGRAGRVEALRHFIEAAMDLGGVRFLTAATLADEVLQEPTSPRRKHQAPRVDPDIYPTW
jgi:peptidoglycan-N-acetylglucosamine deacetylase